MVNKCCAFGCRSGYAPHSSAGVRITFHSFPQDKDLRDKWIRINPRKDFVPSKHSKICSLHFTDGDFIEERHGSNSRRRKKFSKLKCRYLKSDAVPSVFHNAPAYLSSPSARPRLSAATAAASSRRELEARRLATMLLTLKIVWQVYHLHHSRYRTS